jgi:hypothetical protein
LSSTPTGSATRSFFGTRSPFFWFVFFLLADEDDGNEPAQVFGIFGFHSRQTRTDITTGAAAAAGAGAGAGARS